MSTQHLGTAQQLDADATVELFTLDATALGDTIYRWTPGTINDAAVVYQGNTYAPYPIMASGFEWNGRGAFARPKITIAKSVSIASLVINNSDLVGATVKRIKTFKKYLDGQPSADPDAHYGEDVYKVERKTKANKLEIEFELSAAVDQEGKKIPGRQCLRDACRAIYRSWNGSAFDYTKATCPYTGAAYFGTDGLATTAASDRCGKKLSDCALRYGFEPMPFNGFPGMARVPR